MKRLAYVLLAATVLLTGCGGTPTTGSGLYNRSCGACHGTDLSGGVGPALDAGSEAAGESDNYYRRVVREGIGGMGPVGRLNAEQLELVIAHIRLVQSQ